VRVPDSGAVNSETTILSYMGPQPKYLIAVATYRRPALLKRLLDSLAASVDPNSAEIVVIDNDPEASAEATAAEHHLRPRYEVEADPGIASARNRALDLFGERFTAILFVDDDEWVAPDWYDTITGYANGTGADVVQGPVVTVLPEEVPNWIRAGQFFQRPIPPSGTQLTSAATNNALLTRRAWRQAGSPRFDRAFSTTGGSDFDLFWGIRKTGASIWYCAEAIVFEDVPKSRLSWTWLRRRYTRSGIAIVHSHRKHGERLSALLVVRAVALIVGVAELLADVVRGRGFRAAPVERIFKSVGVFAGLFGYRIHEYSR
jgi:succinoglycan biosynthesis protein ExoM